VESLAGFTWNTQQMELSRAKNEGSGGSGHSSIAAIAAYTSQTTQPGPAISLFA
jgi:hypothetical protein